ncbi:MAG TPA: hypothetical protein VJL35_09230 [Gemmatimonadaceae bacterium]|jgi:hypothetical protein|nr:hypothetical protein [Gemmatimonadaceae bacterium]
MLASLENLFAPWQQLYSDSAVVSIAVTALHLLGMLVGGGLAIAADRATLRITGEKPGDRERHLGELNAIHRPVFLALSLLFVTGILMIASDVTTFLNSPILWLKLGLVALLVVNGVVLERTETSLRRADSPNELWGRLRLAAICSIALWIATLVVGTTLVSAA